MEWLTKEKGEEIIKEVYVWVKDTPLFFKDPITEKFVLEGTKGKGTDTMALAAIRKRRELFLKHLKDELTDNTKYRGDKVIYEVGKSGVRFASNAGPL